MRNKNLALVSYPSSSENVMFYLIFWMVVTVDELPLFKEF